MKSLVIQNNKLLNKGIIRHWNVVLLMSLASIVALFFVDRTSLFSYGYALILLTAISYLVSRNEVKDVFFTYHFYLFFAIAFYVIFKYQFPNYLGLSGGADFGTDDGRYFAQIVGGRGINYTIEVSTIDLMAYSILLKVLYPFSVYTPLNIVVINTLFTAFLPIYTRRFANILSDNREVGNRAFWLSMLCPFTIYFGCIIMRDVFTTLLVIAGMCYFLEKKYVHLLFCIVLITWVRFGTISFLICGIIILYRFKLKKKSKDLYFNILLALLLLVFYFAFSFLQDFSGGKLEGGLIRSSDSDFWSDSTIGSIMKLPFPINIVLSTTFFFFIPLLTFPETRYGHYLISAFFQGVLTPLYMFFLWKNIFNTILMAFYGKHREKAKQFFYIALIFSILLGTISLQSRHKTVLFPIICIMAAYGSVYYNKKYTGTDTLIATVIIFVQILLALISLR